MNSRLLAFAFAAAALALAVPAFAQIPNAIDQNGNIIPTTTTALTVAPAGGAVGLGRQLADDNGLPIKSGQVTRTATVVRPANTTAYAANQAQADSTSSPTAGGFTISGAARAAGGAGVITDLVIVSSNDPATTLQGEVWIFDSAVTAVNDAAAFSLSDGDAVKLVGVVPFTLATTMAGSGNNSYAQISNLNIGFTAVGSADLRFLVKVKNAYTPASGEQLTVRAKIQQTN